MDTSRLRRSEVIGAAASFVLLVSLLLLPWYSLTHNANRASQNAWVCGANDFHCTGWETFPLMRWLLLAACAAPLILIWIVARERETGYPTGEITMVVGMTAVVLIGFNGILSKPNTGPQQFGIGLSIGYWLALLAALAMAAAGASRSLEHGGGAPVKPPGTI